MRKEQTNIEIHLHFAFEERVDLVVAEREIRQILGIENIEFGTHKNGYNYFTCAKVKMDTRITDEVISNFLKTFDESPEKLNLVCDKYKGTYYLDIVPWIRKGFLPGIVLEKKLLDFLSNIKSFDGIGIDMYMY